MIRYRRRNEVVPIVGRIVEDDLSGESVVERLIHLPFGFIHLVHNLRKDFQTFLCHGICSPAAGISDGEEGSSAPRAGYLGEEPVFDGVELGAVWRVVHDENLHAYAVRKVHKVLLEDTVSAGVRAASYGRSRHALCSRTRTRKCRGWCLSRDIPCCAPCRRCRAAQSCPRRKSRSRGREPLAKTCSTLGRPA